MIISYTGLAGRYVTIKECQVVNYPAPKPLNYSQQRN